MYWLLACLLLRGEERHPFFLYRATLARTRPRMPRSDWSSLKFGLGIETNRTTPIIIMLCVTHARTLISAATFWGFYWRRVSWWKYPLFRRLLCFLLFLLTRWDVGVWCGGKQWIFIVFVIPEIEYRRVVFRISFMGEPIDRQIEVHSRTSNSLFFYKLF